MDEPRELALLLDNGVVVRDREWRCIADVMAGFRAFGVNRAYGTVVDAETLEPVYPPQLLDPKG